MMKFLPFVALLVLVGCVNPTGHCGTTGNTACLPIDTPKPIVKTSLANDKLAVITRLLSDKCMLAKITLTGASFFIKGATARVWLDNITASVASYCDGPPPENIEDAILDVHRIYVAVITRVPDVKSYVDREWSIYVRNRKR